MKLVYLVIVTNHPNYTKTLFPTIAHRTAKHSFPIFRLNIDNQEIKNILKNSAVKLVEADFAGLTHEGIEYIGSIQQKSIYRIKFQGWPNPEITRNYVWLNDPLDDKVDFTSVKILNRIRKFERRRFNVDANYLSF